MTQLGVFFFVSFLYLFGAFFGLKVSIVGCWVLLFIVSQVENAISFWGGLNLRISEHVREQQNEGFKKYEE